MISGFPKFKQYTEAQMPLATSVPAGTEIFNTTYQVKMRSNGTSWEWLGIGKSTWVNRPATAPLGQIICITDVGENGSLWRGNGTKWVRLHQIKFSDLTGSVSLTGTTSETTLFTLTLPAGVIGSNGKLKLYPLFTATNNGNLKTMRVKLNSLNAYLLGSSSFTQMSAIVIIRNFNSESSQKIASGMTAGLGLATASMNTLSVDTTLETTITVTGQLSNSSDTLTLESLFVELA